jgi:hypothetical protein
MVSNQLRKRAGDVGHKTLLQRLSPNDNCLDTLLNFPFSYALHPMPFVPQ